MTNPATPKLVIFAIVGVLAGLGACLPASASEGLISSITEARTVAAPRAAAVRLTRYAPARRYVDVCRPYPTLSCPGYIVLGIQN